MTTPPYSLLTLRSGSSIEQCKRFTLAPSGAAALIEKRRAKRYEPRLEYFSSLKEFSSILQSLERSTRSTIVRGGLTEAGATQAKSGKWIRRLASSDGDEPATIKDVARGWVALDIDDLPFPKEIDPTSKDGQRAAIIYTISKLPPEFHGVSCFYQWSSSAGVKREKRDQIVAPWTTVKLHLFFLLSRPLNGRDLKVWLKDSIVDLNIFRPQQTLDIARPRFSGVRDPLGSNRSGVIQFEREQVITPSVEWIAARDTLSTSSGFNRRQASKHSFRKDELAQRRGEGILSGAYNRIASTTSGRRAIILGQAMYVGRAIGAGLITSNSAETTLLDAIRSNGWIKKRSEKEARSLLRWAFKEGSQNPLEDRPLSHPASPYRPNKVKFDSPKLTPTAPRVADSRDMIFKEILNSLSDTSLERLDVIALAAGAGKTTASVEAGVLDTLFDVVKQEEKAPLLFLLKTKELAAEAEAKARDYAKKLGLEPKIHLRKSVLDQCSIYKESQPSKQEVMREALECGGRASLCGIEGNKDRCPRAGFCSGAKKQELGSGLTFMTHAMAPFLKDLPDNSRAIFDELPSSTVKTKEIHIKDLESLLLDYDDLHRSHLHARKRAEKWRSDNPQLTQCAEGLSRMLVQLGIETRAQKTNYAETISKKQLSTLLEPIKSDLEALGRSVIADENEKVKAIKPPPKPSANKARDGRRDKAILISRSAFLMTVDLARTYVEGGDLSRFSIRYQGGRAWIEHHNPTALPSCPTVALDATAVETADQWRALARANGREAKIRSIDLSAPSPRAIYVHSTAFRSSHLYKRSPKGEITFKDRAVGALAKAALDVAQALSHLPDGARVGIGTHKALADLLRSVQSEKLDDSITRAIALGPFTQVLSRFEVIIGHTGAQDTGSNIFGGVDGFILLGTPRPDRGALLNQFAALGIPEEDFEQAYRGMTTARTLQWLARPRHVRREKDGEVTLLYVGDEFLNPSPALPSVDWEIKETKSGRARTFDEIAAILEINNHMESGVNITARECADHFNISLKASHGLIAEVALSRPIYQWKERKGKGSSLEIVYSIHPSENAEIMVHSNVLVTDPTLMTDLRTYIYKRVNSKTGVTPPPLRKALIRSFVKEVVMPFEVSLPESVEWLSSISPPLPLSSYQNQYQNSELSP